MINNRQVEVHYINTGFPFTVTESIMDLFEGLTYALSDTALSESLHNPCYGSHSWLMQSNLHKVNLSGSGNRSYIDYSHPYEISDLQTDSGRSPWDISPSINENPPPQVGIAGVNMHGDPEECFRSLHNEGGLQVIWQEGIDPDNITYEELLNLGETVGTQSRGLSKERLSSLPISKYKFIPFSKKRTRGEKCVICQSGYKWGERQMTLPCKHVYHARCAARWLGINKACPICYIEVSPKESTH